MADFLLKTIALAFAVAFSIAFVITPATVQPARAEVQYPWCAQYKPPLDATNCGFTSFEQCLATVRGIGGYCYRNPAYPPPRQRRR